MFFPFLHIFMSHDTDIQSYFQSGVGADWGVYQYSSSPSEGVFFICVWFVFYQLTIESSVESCRIFGYLISTHCVDETFIEPRFHHFLFPIQSRYFSTFHSISRLISRNETHRSPIDILFGLSNYLNLPDDLLLSNPHFYHICGCFKAQLPPVFAVDLDRNVLSPYPDLLFTGIAR